MPSESSVQLQGWLARLGDGVAEARAALIQRSCERLQKLVRQMLKSFGRVRRFEDSDDVLQNVLVRLMRRWEAARPPTVADYFRLAASETRHELIDLTRHYFGPRGAGNREVPNLAEESSGSSLGRSGDGARRLRPNCETALAFRPTVNAGISRNGRMKDEGLTQLLRCQFFILHPSFQCR